MAPPTLEQIQHQVGAALQEDIGQGDLTAALIPADRISEARVVARQPAILCGVDWFNTVFQQLDPIAQINWHIADGDKLQDEQVICQLHGSARALLTGERTALNFIQMLSGVATQAAQYVRAVAGTGVRILDTRKTVPNLRLAQKYAVRCGGADNQRLGLYDAVLIKENHILAAGSIAQAMQIARQQVHEQDNQIQIEVEDLEEFTQALNADAKRILLDNFDLVQLREAVAINQGRARLEASGGVSLQTVRSIAETGVDDISIGGLTKDIQSVDFSMRFV
jgi:nicotinate-nucleotide pyrophosphorylase (carboxylating)